MIELEITKEMMNSAKERDKGKYNDLSFMNGKGNLIGFLGEEIVKKRFPQLEHVDKYSHDFERNGQTIEIKTKSTTRSSAPPDYYSASVAKVSMHQHPDIYIFCRVYDLRKGWIIGWIRRQELFERGIHLKKGDVDPSNNYTVKADCINIFHRDLNSF